MWSVLAPKHPAKLTMSNKKRGKVITIQTSLMSPWQCDGVTKEETVSNYLAYMLQVRTTKETKEPIELGKKILDDRIFYLMHVTDAIEETQKRVKRRNSRRTTRREKKEKTKFKEVKVVDYMLISEERSRIYYFSLWDLKEGSFSEDIIEYFENICKAAVFNYSKDEEEEVKDAVIYAARLVSHMDILKAEGTEGNKESQRKKGVKILWKDKQIEEFIPFQYITQTKTSEYFDKNITLLNSLIKKYPDNKALHFAIAVLYEYDQGGTRYGEGYDMDLAMLHYQKAIDIDARFYDAYFNLAILYYKNNAYDKAIPLFKKVTEMCPIDISAYYLLAEIYKKKGNSEEASKYYDKALFTCTDFEKQIIKKVYDKIQRERKAIYKELGRKAPEKPKGAWKFTKTCGLRHHTEYIDENKLPNIKFSYWDEHIITNQDFYVLWWASLNMGAAPAEDALTAKWYAPDGTLYHEDRRREVIYNQTVLAPTLAPDLMFQLPIAGTEAETKIGLWKLEIYDENELVYERYFYLM